MILGVRKNHVIDKLEVVFPGRVHLIEGNVFWGSRGRSLYYSKDGGVSWSLKILLELTARLRVLSMTRLARRLTRMNINHVVRVDSDCIGIVGFGAIFFFEPQSGKVVSSYPLLGKRPLVVCACEGQVVYGEYSGNPDRKPVRLIAVDVCKGVKVIHAFDGIRHIHGVCRDPVDGSLWVTTGDNDNESAIWRLKSLSSRPELVASGSQQTRAVQLLFDNEHVYYGTDTPLEQNYICRFQRSFGVAEKLQSVSSSVFYGCTVGETHVFSTACEPSKINNQSSVSLYAASPHSGYLQWTELLKLQKDMWPMRLFQYGQVMFPAGKCPGQYLYFTPMGVRGSQNTYRLKLQ